MASKAGTVNEKWAFPTEIEWMTFGKVGDSATGTAYKKVQDVPQAMRVDDTGTYVYLAWGKPGTLDATAEWRIARIDASGNKVWADGDALYNNIWNDRATLNYV